MSRDKLDANGIIDSKSDGSILNSDIMKALEDIDYDLTQVDLESATPEELEAEGLKDIEHDVEVYESEKMEMLLNQAKADIMLEVSWDIVEPSPDKFAVRYNLKGMDTYSLKQITGCDLMTAASGYVNPASMLRQVLQDSFGEFCDRLDRYFSDMGNNGRETSFTFLIKKNSMVNFADEVGSDGDTLADVIEYWFDEETVSGRYTVSAASDNRMVFSQVRIPLYDEKGRAIDARRFVNSLVRKLRGEEYGVAPIKVIAIGLGSCRIEIGD